MRVALLSLWLVAGCNALLGNSDFELPDCVGLECQVPNCAQQGLPPTTLTGIVNAPNGRLPVYGVNVYVPRDPVPPFTEGAQCSQCSSELPGSPVAQTRTDEAGRFRLEDVPSGEDIPVVITTGKWRRQLVIPHIEACTEIALPVAETRLPRTRAEGDIPRIAISTGAADALECLLRKLGIDDSEFATDGGAGRLHLYATAGSGQGASQFAAGFPGGSGSFANSMTLWNDLTKLKSYDLTIFSCEGSQQAQTKPQSAMDAVKAYADLGGRLFLSHWHNVWIEGATMTPGPQRPAVWPMIATFNDAGTTFGNMNVVIDETSNPQGASFATWMLNVMGSPGRGLIPIESNSGKNTVQSIDPARAERWVYWTGMGPELPQNFQFTTPNEAPREQRCGKVSFSDMHVSGDSRSTPSVPFPSQCATTDLTPQERALVFMLFEVGSCTEI
jgi:hypothetical protein